MASATGHHLPMLLWSPLIVQSKDYLNIQRILTRTYKVYWHVHTKNIDVTEQKQEEVYTDMDVKLLLESLSDKNTSNEPSPVTYKEYWRDRTRNERKCTLTWMSNFCLSRCLIRTPLMSRRQLSYIFCFFFYNNNNNYWALMPQCRTVCLRHSDNRRTDVSWRVSLSWKRLTMTLTFDL